MRETVKRQLLLVEDEELLRVPIAMFFRDRGYVVQEADGYRSAEAAFRASRPDVAIIDYSLGDRDGLQLLAALRALDSSVPTLVLTGHGTIELAVKAIKEGADQFLTKPVDLPTLESVVQRLIEHQRNRQVRLAGQSRQARDPMTPFLGTSPAVRRLEEQARTLAGLSKPILIQGETGSGKGVLAQWLHRFGPRADESFVDLNCAALSRELLESELFGHDKGAFTGAVSSKPGLFEIAHRGTLFLDEVGDMDLSVQPKLLKVLEDQRFRRVGEVRDRQVDVRLIAATHRDLGQLVKEGKFREDLYYRIHSLTLVVPPLRTREGDLVTLAHSIIEQVAAEMGRPAPRLSPEAEGVLAAYPWPGNIRELRNVLERAVILGGSAMLTPDDLGDVVTRWSAPAAAVHQGTLKQVERAHIELTLHETNGDVPRAAARLGISRSALYAKIQKHGITSPQLRRRSAESGLPDSESGFQD